MRSIRGEGIAGLRRIGLLGNSGGSITPAPTARLGGPPDIEEDACASGSSSHFVNSYGIRLNRELLE
jgi:hypothetical protein